MTSTNSRLKLLQASARQATKNRDWEKAIAIWNQLTADFPSHFPAYVGKANALIAQNELDRAEAIFKQSKNKFPHHIQSFDGLVKVAFRQKNWNKALQQCDTLVKHFPQSEHGYRWQGKIFIELQEFEKAADAFSKLLETHPNNPTGLRGLANINVRQQHWQEVLEVSQVIVEAFPHDLKGQEWQATANFKLGWNERAEAIFHQIIEHHPDEVEGYRGLTRLAVETQQWSLVVDRCRSLVKQFPHYLQGYLWQGTAFLELGRFEQSTTLYETLTQQYEDHPHGYQGLAQVAMRCGKWQEALQYWNTLIKRFPTHVAGYLGKCNALENLGQLTAIDQVCEQAIKQCPEAAVLYQRMGDAHRRTLDTASAEKAYRRGLAMQPGHYVLHLRLADLLLVSGHHAECIALLNIAIKLNSAEPRGYQALATALFEKGEIKASLGALTQGIKANPRNPAAYTNLAHFHWLWENETKLAWKNLDKAIELAPFYMPAYIQKAEMLAQLGRVKSARLMFEQLIEQFQHKPNGYIGLAQLEASNGNYRQAIDLYKIVLDRFPQQKLSVAQALTQVLMQIGALSEAEKIYQQLKREYANRHEGSFGLGLIAERRLQWNTALEIWATINRKFPNVVAAYNRRANLLIQLGDLKKAQDILTQLCQRHAVAHLWQARAKFRNSQYDEALKHLQDASEKGFFVAANRQILLLALRIGKAQEIDRVSQFFWNRKLTLCSSQVFEALCHAQCQLNRGTLQEAWQVYLAIFSTEYGRNRRLVTSPLPTDPIVFVIFLLSLAKAAVKQSDVKLFNATVTHVQENQLAFECQPDLLSYLYLIKGTFLDAQHSQATDGRTETVVIERSNSKRTPVELSDILQYSLALNPNNRTTMTLIQQRLQQQWKKPLLGSVVASDTTSQAVESAIMLISCQKNIERIHALRCHLYSKMDMAYYFVVGDSQMNEEWRLEDDILYVKAADNYESLSRKVLKAYEFFYCCSQFKGVWKLDDDCWINSIEQFQVLTRWVENKSFQHYLGRVNGIVLGRSWHFTKCASSETNTRPYSLAVNAQYCAGGSGYYLSRDALKILFEHTYKYPDSLFGELYEDVMVGKILSTYEIKPYPLNLVSLNLIKTEYDPRWQSATVESLYEDAEQLLKDHDLERAVGCYHKILMIEADQPVTTYLRLLAWLKEIDQQEALALAHIVHKKFPDFLESVDELWKGAQLDDNRPYALKNSAQ